MSEEKPIEPEQVDTGGEALNFFDTQTPETRAEGVEKIIIFLKKLLSSEDLVNSDSFVEYLRRIDFEQFKQLILRLSGIIGSKKANERTFNKDFPVTIYTSPTGEQVVRQFHPKDEAREYLLHSLFDTLQQLTESPHPERNQHLAITLLNGISFIHPVPDANGRISRLSYFLLSSRVNKSKEDIEENLRLALSRMTGLKLKGYFESLDEGVYRVLLMKEGISDTLDEDGFVARLEVDPYWNGFDYPYLGYLAAYKTMTPGERERYGHETTEPSIKSFVFNELPEDIKERIWKEIVKIKVEQVGIIIKAFADPKRGMFPHFQSVIDYAFDYQNDPERENALKEFLDKIDKITPKGGIDVRGGMLGMDNIPGDKKNELVTALRECSLFEDVHEQSGEIIGNMSNQAYGIIQVRMRFKKY